MAIVKATSSGSWVPGVSHPFDAAPADGDTIYTNGYTVTIAGPVDLPNSVLTNASTTGVAAGGKFQLLSDNDVTVAGVVNGGSQTTLELSNGTAFTATLSLGEVVAGPWHAIAVVGTAGSVLEFVDTWFKGGASGSRQGLIVTVGTTITWTRCSATAGPGNATPGVYLTGNSTSSGTLNAINSPTSQATTPAVQIDNGVHVLNGTVHHSGAYLTLYVLGGIVQYTITAETFEVGFGYNNNYGVWYCSTGGALTVIRPSGSLEIPTAYLRLTGAGSITLQGDFTCGTASGRYVVSNGGSGDITIDGTVTGSSVSSAYNGLWATSTGRIAVRHLVAHPTSGEIPSMLGSIRFFNDTTISVTTADDAALILVDAESAGDYPAIGDVRKDVVYAFESLTGTCAVPGAFSVAAGVPIDDTVGTAVLTAAGVRSSIETLSDQVSAVAGQLTGGRFAVVGAVSPAGKIRLYYDTDYTGSDIVRTISDPGGVIHAKLTAGELSDLRFGGFHQSGLQISGTVTAVAFTAGATSAADVTSVTIAIAKAAIPDGPYSADWRYHVDRVAGGVTSPPLIEGDLQLQRKGTTAFS